jgi:hypothetical protein
MPAKADKSKTILIGRCDKEGREDKRPVMRYAGAPMASSFWANSEKEAIEACSLFPASVHLKFINELKHILNHKIEKYFVTCFSLSSGDRASMSGRRAPGAFHDIAET